MENIVGERVREWRATGGGAPRGFFYCRGSLTNRDPTVRGVRGLGLGKTCSVGTDGRCVCVCAMGVCRCGVPGIGEIEAPLVTPPHRYEWLDVDRARAYVSTSCGVVLLHCIFLSVSVCARAV